MKPTDLGTRRIQSLSGSAFVSLPKFWTKYQRLEKGDLVSVVLMEDGSLKISPAGAV